MGIVWVVYQTISETINVLGIFRSGSFTPKKFNWQHQTYPIEEITSIHEVRDGGVVKRHYAIVSGSNLFLLEYNRNQETWKLAQIWSEG